MFWDDKNSAPREIMPVHHDRGSAFATTAGSVAGEGLKGTAHGAVEGIKWGGLTGALVLGGFVALLFFGGPIFGAIGSAVTAITTAVGGGTAAGGGLSISLPILAIGGAAIVGGAIGAFKGLFAGGILGGLFGAGKGMKEGHEQVSQERAAAHAMDQQLGVASMQTQMMMMQAQAAQHHAPAARPAAHHGFPPHGHDKNPASPKINAADIAHHSTLADRQMQLA